MNTKRNSTERKVISKFFTTLFFILIIIFSNSSIYSQSNFETFEFDANKHYIFKLKDGNEFIGTFLSKDAASVTIHTSSIPQINIPFQNIISIKAIGAEQIKEGEYWFPNPNYHRYFLSNSAMNLQKGEGYYQNIYILFNSFGVALTNNFTIGGGFELISLFSEAEPIYFLTPKLGFQVDEKISLGAGLLYVNTTSSNTSGVGIFYGLFTYGSKDNNLTIGLGWGYSNEGISDSPAFTLSGMTRISKKVALISENWFLPFENSYRIYSYGVRFFGESISVDLGFFNNSDISEAIFIGFPYVGFVVKF